MTFKKKFLKKSPFPKRSPLKLSEDARGSIQGIAEPLFMYGVPALMIGKTIKRAVTNPLGYGLPLAAGIGAAHLVGRAIKKRKARKREEQEKEMEQNTQF
tara:strand:+ start:596 stop:895 length:300 start_codon:yes stop_codon:yes gene_type:complete